MWQCRADGDGMSATRMSEWNCGVETEMPRAFLVKNKLRRGPNVVDISPLQAAQNSWDAGGGDQPGQSRCPPNDDKNTSSTDEWTRSTGADLTHADRKEG